MSPLYGGGDFCLGPWWCECVENLRRPVCAFSSGTREVEGTVICDSDVLAVAAQVTRKDPQRPGWLSDKR